MSLTSFVTFLIFPNLFFLPGNILRLLLLLPLLLLLLL
jgi:hypothetical protein